MSVYFVWPVDDLIQHDNESADCICGPTQHHEKAEDGSIHWIITHHALDGRE